MIGSRVVVWFNYEVASANSVYQASYFSNFQAVEKISEEQVVPSDSLEVLYLKGFFIASAQLLSRCLLLNQCLQNLLN